MRTAILLGALVLAASVQAAPGGATSSLTAQQAEWQGAHAGMRLLAVRDLQGPSPFGLAAPAIHVRAVEADAYAMTPDRTAFYTPGWRATESDLANAVLQVHAGRAGSFLYVLPGVATVTMGCGAAQAARPASVQAPSQVEAPNPNPHIPLRDALRLEPCGPVQVCGDFTVVLWERDVTGSSAGGPVRLESGQLARPGEPDARPVLGRARQVYLSASGGCLSSDGAGIELFAEGVSLGAARSLVLREARGTLAGVADDRAAGPGGSGSSSGGSGDEGSGGAGVRVAGDLQVAGSLDAILSRDGAALGVRLAGALDAAAVDGRPLAVAPSAPPAAPRWAWSLSLLVAAPAAALAARWMLGNRTDALARRAEAASRERQWSRVLDLTARRLSHGDDPKARVLRAQALLVLQDPQQALAQAQLAVERLPDGPTKADAALVACRASSRLGRDAEALAWLGEVYAQDVRTAEHALRFPEVARLAAPDAGYA